MARMIVNVKLDRKEAQSCSLAEETKPSCEILEPGGVIVHHAETPSSGGVHKRGNDMKAENLRYRIDIVGRRVYKHKDSVTRRLEIIQNHYRYSYDEKDVPFHEIFITVYYLSLIHI